MVFLYNRFEYNVAIFLFSFWWFSLLLIVCYSFYLFLKNVAEKYGVSRKKQDEFAVESHKKAARAQALNLFSDEIVQFTAKYKDKDGKVVEALVKTDEGVRKDASFEGLSKLKPAFKKDGSTTAGNSSQVFSILISYFYLSYLI